MTSLPIRTWMIALLIAFVFSGCSRHTPQDQQFTLTSDYSLNGEFLISVHLPENYDADDRNYPVVYMTDADWFFGMATDMAYMMSFEDKHFILVGIGYGDRVTCRDKRLKDMGSDLNADGIPAYALYQSFLKDELFPAIEKRYRAQSTNRTYFGWSLGALFANHLLYEQRDLFDNYILGGGRFPLDWAEHMKNSIKQPRNERPLSLYVGFPERDASREDYTAMIASLVDEDLADIFLTWDIYPDQGHDIESTADVLWKGLHDAFSQKSLGTTLINIYQRSGLDGMLTSFETWKSLRPELSDYSPLILMAFVQYLDAAERQQLKDHIDQYYPPQSVVFHLKTAALPEGRSVHITGNHPAIGYWDPAATVLEQTPDGQWTGSFEIMRGTGLEYKFTLGSWDTEALDVNGQTLPNFKLNVEKDTVISVVIPKWKEAN